MRQLSDYPQMGQKRLSALAAQGITTPLALAARFPLGYQDYTAPTPIAQLRQGMQAAFRGTLVRPPSISGSGKLSITYAVFDDGTGQIRCAFFNRPYLRTQLKPGGRYLLHGYVASFQGRLTVNNPRIVPPGEENTIQPVYSKMDAVPPKTYRSFVRIALCDLGDMLEDVLPAEVRSRYDLCPLWEAYFAAHFPPNAQALAQARRRLAFDELYFYQIALGLARGLRGERGVQIGVDERAVGPIVEALPYPLTGAQRRCVQEILSDLRNPSPMARLLQGDVGSGKTAVAMLALAACVRGGYQGAMMVPTEVLAAQHYQSLTEVLGPFGMRVGLLTGSMTQAQHKKAHAAIASGEWDIVVGTHALITASVDYHNLGLVITDEQHRFGVRQRAALTDKGMHPNVLAMSATPIPRTVCLVLYGDLDVSLLDEMPPGRQPVSTHLVPEKKREGMLGFLQGQVEQGRQGYVICPLVAESDTLDLISAQETFEALQKALPELNVGLLHGQMRPAQKQEALDAFYDRRTDILVSTTVVEVGVNVPNASFIVVEGAERFGLAQLHQLRGRVGRGGHASYCFLMADGSEKLKILTKTSDGFEIAQKDMEQRGPGEMLGTRQSGLLSPELASGSSDMRLLSQTQSEARHVLSHKDDPKYEKLIGYVHQIFAKRLEQVSYS